MKQIKMRVNLNIVNDGQSAIKYLRKQDEYKDAVRPDLVLLDLNLPDIGGHKVLYEIKNDEGLKSIPVVVLTTSDADEDIIHTYTLGASCYVTKPVGLKEFSKMVENIENFWFTIVKFPPKI
jgi:two-component system response regulator